MKVLIAEDSAAVRERLVALTSELGGCEVRTANDAVEALAGAASFEPDVVILDLHMPRGSGLDVLRKLKAKPAPPLVIVLTNDPSEQNSRFCLRNRADHFFDKARDCDRVLEVLAHAQRG